ncbi:MAG TPA: hypothetical protein IGS52_13085 [Oscillatoriaceae cyanobacterium M33_DOE_052]|uniref:Uncharacterized protein n=1 Tax=Planktothricoides sp. SpSt-374 TaxID=2282167 RepID=A0A7C3ZN39_9CYAN|nr:hypothetical protein [Oscillatoriaceae cyanobacterium M33_DOE_052]
MERTLQPRPTVAEIFCTTLANGQITRRDRESLRRAFLADSIRDDEYAAIDRMLHAVKRGWLMMVD